MTDQRARRNLRSHWIAIAFFIIVGIVVVILYFSQAKNEFKEGMAAYNAFDLLTANKHFQRVTGFYRWASLANTSQAQTLMDTEIQLLLSAQDKRSQGDFAGALDAYDTFANSYPESVHSESIKTYTADTYLEWGDSLLQTAKYEEAIEKYQMILTDYQTETADQTAVSKIATAYLNWGDKLVEAKNYQEAVKKYRIVITDYHDQSAARTVAAQMSMAYLNWGDTLAQTADEESAIKQYLEVLILDEYKNQPPAQVAFKGILDIGQQLIGKGSFLAAMRVFTVANALVDDPGQQAELEVIYQAAFARLAEDSGTDGQEMIEDALQDACDGKPRRSPVIGASQSQSAKIGMCGAIDGIEIPEEWQATTPGSLKYAIAIHSTESLVGTCQYVDSLNPSKVVSSINLIMPIKTIYIYNTTTGAVVSQKEIPGTAPGRCIEKFVFGSPSDITGGSPSPETIQKALMDWVSPLITTSETLADANLTSHIPVLNPGSIIPLSYTLLEGHTDTVTSVAFSPDGELLASASVLDSTVRLWDVEGGAQVRTLDVPALTANAIFSPDGTLLAVGSEIGTESVDATVNLWDVASGTPMQNLGQIGTVKNIIFSPDGKLLATVGSQDSLDQSVQIWNVTSGAQEHTLETVEWVDSVAFSPDGKWLATAWSVDGLHRTVKLWDVTRHVEIRSLGSDMLSVADIAFSPDGKWLAVAGHPDSKESFVDTRIDNVVKVWDVSTGDEVHTLNHLESMYGIAFSPDGKSLAIGFESQPVKLWEIGTGTELYMLEGQNNKRMNAGFVLDGGITFSPNGKWLATVSENTVELRELWKLKPH